MKTSARLFLKNLRWNAVGLAVGLVAGASGWAQTATTNNAASAEDAANWITLGVGGAAVSGNRAQFQERWGLPQGPSGGLRDFHYEWLFGQKGILEADGRAMYGQQDFSVKLGVVNPDVGYLRGGFKQTKTWYDGTGGYYPPTGKVFSLNRDDLAIRRGEYWIEGGFTPPDGPMLTLKLAHEFRQGTKDSLIWGDSTQGATTRGMVPSFREIDELRNIIVADLKQTFGQTDVGFGVRLDLIDNNNEFKEERRPGEAADRYVTQRDVFKADMLNFHAFTESRLSERVWLTSGYAYTRLNTDVGGSRIYGAGYDAPYLVVYPGKQARDEGYVNLSGGSIVDQYVMNLSLRWEPVEHLVLVPSLRAEKIDTTGSTQFTENTVGAAPGLVTTSDNLLNSRQNGFQTVSEALEARYTGCTNWVLYARGEWSESDGYLREMEQNLSTSATTLSRSTDSTRFTQKYTFGANWYPLRRLHFAGQYYHKEIENDYTHLVDSTPNTTGTDRYPAYLLMHKFTTDDFNLRATWRLQPNLTAVTRYDYQISTIDTVGGALAEIESARTRAHIISETLTWVPWSRLLLQGSFSYALDSTTTPASALTGAASNLVPDARNDYWQASAAATFVVDDLTDLQANYFYFRANNFINNATVSLPYGTSANDHTVNVSLSRKFSPRVKGTLSYGYFIHRDETSGGLDNYQAHLIFSSLTYRF